MTRNKIVIQLWYNCRHWFSNFGYSYNMKVFYIYFIFNLTLTLLKELHIIHCTRNYYRYLRPIRQVFTLKEKKFRLMINNKRKLHHFSRGNQRHTKSLVFYSFEMNTTNTDRQRNNSLIQPITRKVLSTIIIIQQTKIPETLYNLIKHLMKQNHTMLILLSQPALYQKDFPVILHPTIVYPPNFHP